MSRLALTLDWQPGEAPMSLISRVAALNGAGLMQDFVRDMGFDWQKICAGSASQICRMADLLCVDPHAFLHEMIAVAPNRKYLFHEQVIDKRMVNRKSVRVCPDCLLEDQERSELNCGYSRSVWQLTHYRVCPDHKRVLVQLTASLENSRDFARYTRKNWPLIADEAGKARKPHADQSAGFEAWLIGRLNGSSGDAWLDGLDVNVAAPLCEKLGALITCGSSPDQGGLNLERLAAATEYGFQQMRSGIPRLLTKRGSTIEAEGPDSGSVWAGSGAGSKPTNGTNASRRCWTPWPATFSRPGPYQPEPSCWNAGVRVESATPFTALRVSTG